MLPIQLEQYTEAIAPIANANLIDITQAVNRYYAARAGNPNSLALP